MIQMALVLVGRDRRLNLEPGRTYVLGRDPQADLVLDDNMFTWRRHCEVERRGGTVVVKNLGTGVTYVNGNKVTAPVQVRPGDRLEVGSSLVFIESEQVPVPEDIESQRRASAPGAPPPPAEEGELSTNSALSFMDAAERGDAEDAPPRPGAGDKRSLLGPRPQGRPAGVTPATGLGARPMLGGAPSALEKAVEAARAGAAAAATGSGAHAAVPAEAAPQRGLLGGVKAPPSGTVAAGSKKGFPSIAAYDFLAEYADVKGGRAFHARSKSDGRDCVVKVLEKEAAQDEALVERFTREALALRRLAHPNIVQIRSAGREAGNLYYVTEYVASMTLADMLRRGPIGERAAITIGIQIANALAQAHSVQVIHRDVSPASIVVTDQGISKLFNFAFVKSLGDERRKSVTSLGDVVGDIWYSSPEQATDPRLATPLADLYSLGAVLYHAVAGRPPYVSKNQLEHLRMLVTQEPRPLADVVPGTTPVVNEIVMRLLAREPERRYPSAEALAEALRAGLGAVVEADRRRQEVAEAEAAMRAASGSGSGKMALPPGANLTPVGTPPGTSASSIGLAGEYSAVELGEIVQFLEFTKRSGVLHLSGGPAVGEIAFREGTIIGSRSGEVTGEEAVSLLLGSGRGVFQFTPIRDKSAITPDQGLKLSASAAALTAMKSIDDEARGA